MDKVNSHISHNSTGNGLVKRKKIMATVTEAIVNSDDDDVGDGMDACKLMENENIQIASASALQALGETIKNTLLEINAIREQNRERRHKELLQILVKMVPQENIKSKDYNADERKPSFTQDYTKNECAASENSENNNRSYMDSPTPSQNVSSKNVKVVTEDILSDQPQVSNFKNVGDEQNDKELKKMRTIMLETQRKKMEDRERKKREFTRMLNV